MSQLISRWTPAVLIVIAGSVQSRAVSPFEASLELSSLNGANGFVIKGAASGDFSGSSVSSAGDINGDGVDDIIIGAPFADPNGVNAAGESYIIFGSTSVGAGGAIELFTIGAPKGYVLRGVDENDRSGVCISAAGDVNGDGIDDLIIGAPSADPNGVNDAGECYVIFGSVNVGAGGTLELSSLDGSNGFVVNGVDAGDRSGESVSGAGDINGDGLSDLVIGAYDADPNGESSGACYVVFGSVNIGAGGTLELSSLNGSNGFVINGVDEGDQFGASVSAAGDVNGDGLDDLIVGARQADPNGADRAGESFVLFGAEAIGAGGSMELSSLTGSNGFVINGVNANDRSGAAVSCAGDINGDGVDDLLIGAYLADPNALSSAGASHVVFGDAGLGAGGSLDLASLNGSNGFVINGVDAFDKSGRSVSFAGDVNGDGASDLVIGAYGASSNGTLSGESYVIFGSPYVGAGGSLDPASLSGGDGFVVNGVSISDISGRSVSAAGDINNDGVDDIIIGAPWADPNYHNLAGETYIVFGRTTCLADLNADGVIDTADLGVLLAQFNTPGSGADINGDGVVDTADLGVLIAAFGNVCP